MPTHPVTRNLRFLLLLAATLVILLSVDYLGAFAGVDTYFYDTFLRLRGTRPTSNRIVIVAVDAKTLDRFGQWPIRRRHYAELLGRLDQAAVVGFDLLLREQTADDGLLEAAIKRHGKVVLPVYVGAAAQPIGPLDRFASAATGHIHIELGVDNTARELFHSVYANKLLPSLSSKMYEAVSEQPLLRLPPPVSTTGRLIQQDHHTINYYGTPGAFTRISLADLLDGTVQPAYFKDKLVLVGLTVPGILDEVSTPLSQTRNRMPGVEVHANALNNLLDKSSIHELPGFLRAFAALLTAFLLAVVLARSDEKQAVLIWILSLFVTLLAAFALLAAAHWWVSPSLFLVAFSVIFAAVYLYRLDSAARKLDHEYEIMTALLGRDANEAPEQVAGSGLFGFLSEGGINAKIGRQVGMTTKLLGLHKQLESALKTEREALDSQIRFVEMLSHEYRTPLAIIRANLDILEMKDEDLGGQLSGNFSKMKRAVSRLVEVMETSLGRQRLEEARTAQPTSEDIDFSSFLDSLLAESGELWAERRFERYGGGCSGCFVHGDRLMLKTAVLNLIDNAVKYSAVQEPVRVFLEKRDGQAVVSVVNQGTTVAPEELERVFDKFYRGGSSVNTRGAGLGLYLVRKIIEQLGGSVTLTSDDSHYTTATISLPLCQHQ
ncbi:sensor domain CHASE2-containing protein [Trichlorobacter thiogenes]|uniref:histidine kinase n=1 Tax=Trichlorobacter thiogenes TaxID=115783 RepID=A0A1T4M0N3_9BACT|nr:CHASE2 domain-containing protein [Trichlorobacter thiogenes]SJZ60456.1 sensor domain CHASE2-containing protein [Trichlorobacter thiogenes]